MPGITGMRSNMCTLLDSKADEFFESTAKQALCGETAKALDPARRTPAVTKLLQVLSRDLQETFCR